MHGNLKKEDDCYGKNISNRKVKLGEERIFSPKN